MKKLMILASAIATACVVNAANFVWGFYSDAIEDSTGSYIDGGSALLYLGTVTASESAFDTSSAVLLATAGQSADYNFGNFDTSNLSSSDALTSTDAGQAYTLILLEETGVTSLDGYEGNYILATGSSARGMIPGTSETTYYADFINDNGYSASDWSKMGGSTPVPEPTSGLLLMLGMAGLALKRKRA